MEELDLKAIYTMLCRKKFLVIGIILISIIFGCVYSYKMIEPDYKSSTTLILGRIVDSGENKGFDVDNRITQTEIAINSNLVSTYSELIKSKTLIKKVKNNLGITINDQDLRDSITVSRLSETELIEITVKNNNPDLASNIANEIAKVFSEKIQEIYNIQNVYIIDAATPDYIPYNINHVKDIIIFAVLGFIVSFGILILYSILDTTIKSADDIENEIGLKNLNIIPIKKQDIKGEECSSELITYEKSKSITSEAFRTLRTNIQFSNINNKENKILLLTSCFSSEGKSYVSANLAVAFAQAGKKVILIDADMRRGRQAKIFNIPNELGLSNYLSNLDRNGMEINERINKYINETEVKNLNVITSGNVPPNPSELLTSNRLPELVKELGVFYDLVIFDGAPILPIADSLILARMANSTVLVTLYNKTKKDELLKAKKDIQNIGGRIIGTVLNKVPFNNYEYNNRYYYSNNDDTSSIFKKLEIRRQIRKEKKERKKSEFKGLNFDREKKVSNSDKIKGNIKTKIKTTKYKLSNVKNKIKEFLNRFKKEETKLLDMSKDEKEIYIRNQKREREIQIKKEKQALKEKRKQERQEAELNKKIEKEREKEAQKLNMSIENISLFTDGLNKDTIKETEKNENIDVNLNVNLNNENINNKDVQEKVEKVSKEVIPPSEAEYKVEKMGNFIEETIKLEVEKNLDEQIKKIETEIKSEEEKNSQENVINTKNIENKENKENEEVREKTINKTIESVSENLKKVKVTAKEKYEIFKVKFAEGRKELKDLKEKLSDEFKVKREENLTKRIEKKAEKDAYNARKNQDKEEREALRKEELQKYKQIRDEERAKQAAIRDEERKVREAERVLKRQLKENERKELAQKKLAQKGLREAEKENRKNKREALKMKQKEEARIKEEILEDNLYPKTKYNKDI